MYPPPSQDHYISVYPSFPGSLSIPPSQDHQMKPLPPMITKEPSLPLRITKCLSLPPRFTQCIPMITNYRSGGGAPIFFCVWGWAMTMFNPQQVARSCCSIDMRIWGRITQNAFLSPPPPLWTFKTNLRPPPTSSRKRISCHPPPPPAIIIDNSLRTLLSGPHWLFGGFVAMHAVRVSRNGYIQPITLRRETEDPTLLTFWWMDGEIRSKLEGLPHYDWLNWDTWLASSTPTWLSKSQFWELCSQFL